MGEIPYFQYNHIHMNQFLQIFFKTLTHIYISGRQFRCYKHRILRSDGDTSLNKKKHDINDKLIEVYYKTKSIFAKLYEYLTLLKSERK